MSRSESPTFNALTFNALSITAFCCVKSRIYNTKRPHLALQDADAWYLCFFSSPPPQSTCLSSSFLG